MHQAPDHQYSRLSPLPFDDFELGSIEWLNDDCAFDHLTTPTQENEKGIDGPAQSEVAKATNKPPVLQALSSLPISGRRTMGRSAIAKCATIEDALVTLLSATNNGRVMLPRVPTMVNLLEEIPKGSREAQTYACMLLINVRMDRNLKSTGPGYVKLAQALPANLPDELGPYRNVIVARARYAIRKIKEDFPESAADGDLQLAINTIEEKLAGYERQVLHHTQVPTEILQRKADAIRASAGGQMKRKHESLVQVEAKKPAKPDQTNKWHGVPFNAGDISNQPAPRRDLPLISPTADQFNPQSVMHTTPSNQSLRGPTTPTPHITINPLPPQWAPAGFFNQMLAMEQMGKFFLNTQISSTIKAFAACSSRQQLAQAMNQIRVDGFIDVLALMRTFNEEMAGEIALATTLHYMENGLPMPDAVVPQLANALALVKRLPDDVTFTFNLAMQAAQLPPALRDAMQSLFNDLMHQKRK